LLTKQGIDKLNLRESQEKEMGLKFYSFLHRGKIKAGLTK
jgi:hypothetical protein